MRKLEQLTLARRPETLAVLIGTRNGPGQDIALRNCAVVNRHPVWYRNGQYRFSGNCVLIAGTTENLEIRGCFIEGCSPLTSMMQPMRRAVIAGNTATSFPPCRTDCTTFRKPTECIFEDNYFLYGKRGFVAQPQGMAVHNLIAGNHCEHTERGSNAGEIEMWEGGTVAAGGKVKAATARTLTGDGIAWTYTDSKGRSVRPARQDRRLLVPGHEGPRTGAVSLHREARRPDADARPSLGRAAGGRHRVRRHPLVGREPDPQQHRSRRRRRHAALGRVHRQRRQRPHQ